MFSEIIAPVACSSRRGEAGGGGGGGTTRRDEAESGGDSKIARVEERAGGLTGGEDVPSQLSSRTPPTH